MNSSAISVLGAAGLHGHEAESALRRILAEMASPSESSCAVFADLGLEPSQVDCSLRRNATVFRKLAEAGIDREQAKILFGDAADTAMFLVENHQRLV